MMKTVILFSVLFFCKVFAFPEEENDDKGGLLFGGDMMLNPLQRMVVETGGDLSKVKTRQVQSRAAMKDANILWLPNDKTVPYTIDDKLANEAEATLGMMRAFREWEERSCLKFKRRDNEDDYVNFFKDGGCWSYVGRQGGPQNISLGEGCWGIGTVVHEIGHAVGFGHEQNRPDRDQYIKIRWENVPESKKHNFQKYNDSKVDSLNSTYDYKSFMQYSKKAFGVNDTVTLDPIQQGVFQLGQRVGFTHSDQQQAMGLYRCKGNTTRKTPTYERYVAKGDDVCDFENGLCHYTQDTNDDFDWTQRYGDTPSGNTGPEVDHTTSRMGVFMFIEASLPRVKGDKARLRTKYFPAVKEPQCLSFFLHMFSKNKTMMGDFNVYLNDANNTDVLLLHKSASQGVNDWTNVQMTFKPEGRYQIVFEGVRGDGYQGDIALDDITFNANHCLKSEKTKSKRSVSVGPCADSSEREGHYCQQWKKAGFCSSQEKYMLRFCKKTCNAC